MKWLLASTLALGLMAAAPAVAAPAGNQQVAQRDRDRDHYRRSGPRTQQRRDTHRRTQRHREQQRYDWRHYRPGHAPRDWSRHRSFDMRGWQYNRRATRRYRWHRYHRPSGWYYRRWMFGMVLPSLFWTRNYWINDYWQFGLANPPYGYVWVRYGSDAILVNVSSGYILQVVYGLYY